MVDMCTLRSFLHDANHTCMCMRPDLDSSVGERLVGEVATAQAGMAATAPRNRTPEWRGEWMPAMPTRRFT